MPTTSEATTPRHAAYELAELLWRVLRLVRLDVQVERTRPVHLLLHLDNLPTASAAEDLIRDLDGVTVEDVRDVSRDGTRWLDITATWQRTTTVTFTVFHRGGDR